MNEPETAIRTLEATPRVLAALIAGAPVHLLAPAPSGEWNVATVVAHLILTGRRGAINRIRQIASEDNPPLQNRDEEEELAASGLRAERVEVTLATFTAEREADIAWLRGCEDGVWTRTGTHSVAGIVTAGEFLQHAAYHDALHIAQMTAMIQAHYEPLRGAMRRF